MSSNPPIGNGQSPNKGDRVKAKHISDLNEKIKRLSRSADVNQNIATKFIEIPFDVSVKIKEGTSNPYQFQISVSRGLVVERQLSAGEAVDALIYHVPDNLLTTGEPTWFDIDDGESLYVKVLETSAGVVNGGVNLVLVVLPSTTESTNYITTIQAGEYYYKICEFEIVSEKPEITRFCAGSNIFHETGLTHDIQYMTCEDPIDYTQTQLGRLSFTSGRLVSVGEAEADRPLATSNQQIDITACS